MPMLAELVDAVVGVDTHRDTHQVEIALPNGAPIAVTTISNDTTGYAELLAWIVDHAPGPRLAVSIEGTRSYGVGLARAAGRGRPGRGRVRAAPPQGPPREAASPTRSTRTWPCWPRCAWTPTGCPPRARTATARRCGSCSVPARNSPPPAPRRPTGCARCCWAATTPTASSPAARSPRPAWPAGPAPAAARGQPRAGRAARRDPPPRARPARGRPRAQGQPRPAADHRQRPRPRADRRDAASARSAPPRPSCRSPTPAAAATTPRSPPWPAPARCRPAAGAPCGTGSTAAATAPSTGPCTPSPLTRMRSCPRTHAYVARRTAEGKNPTREIRRCLKRLHRPRALPRPAATPRLDNT